MSRVRTAIGLIVIMLLFSGCSTETMIAVQGATPVPQALGITGIGWFWIMIAGFAALAYTITEVVDSLKSANRPIEVKCNCHNEDKDF